MTIFKDVNGNNFLIKDFSGDDISKIDDIFIEELETSIWDEKNDNNAYFFGRYSTSYISFWTDMDSGEIFLDYIFFHSDDLTENEIKLLLVFQKDVVFHIIRRLLQQNKEEEK